MPEIALSIGDITLEDVDAVVNAANTSLRAGGGVDGAITRAAGPEALVDRERVINERGRPPLRTGEAVATIGGNLPARWIIHTAGPVYHGTESDADLLRTAHLSCLRIADTLGAATLAFPAISTGVYGYPLGEAAPIAISAVRDAVTSVQVVRFVLYDDAALRAFERARQG